jgi:hypothetical protein
MATVRRRGHTKLIKEPLSVPPTQSLKNPGIIYDFIYQNLKSVMNVSAFE